MIAILQSRKIYFGKEEAEKISFDIDKRGGIKIIHLNENFDLNVQGGIKKVLIFENIFDDFIPIKTYKSNHLDDNILSIEDKFYDILENTMLKYKYKYFFNNGIVLKCKFKEVYNHPYYDYTYYNYEIVIS